MRSSPKPKILLDSTYLLPIVGVKVEGIDDVLRALAEIWRERKAEFYYTPFNMLEIMGKIAKTEYDERIAYLGLSTISDEFKAIQPTVEGYLKAMELRRKGFKDIIDLLLYTTSLTRNTLFLTRDSELIRYLSNLGENIENIITEEKLIKNYV